MRLVVPEAAPPPKVPPHIHRCLKEMPRLGKTVDEGVVNLIELDHKKRACQLALEKWENDLGKPVKKVSEKKVPVS